MKKIGFPLNIKEVKITIKINGSQIGQKNKTNVMSKIFFKMNLTIHLVELYYLHL